MEERLEMTFNSTEQSILTQAIAIQEPSILIKVQERMNRLMSQINSSGVFTYTRDELWSLFGCLIHLHPTIWGESKRKLVTTELIKRLWGEVIDRRKEEALWSIPFRERMDAWGVAYKEDMIRIGVPETMDDEEEYEKLDEDVEKEIIEHAKTFADQKMVNTFLYILPDPENEFDQVFEIEDPNSYDIKKSWMAVMGEAYANYYRDNVPYDNSSENISTVELVLHAIKKHDIPLVRYWDSSNTEKINLRWLNEQRK